MIKKARNIVRNNMQKTRVEYIGLTAQTAHKFIRAFDLFQASQQAFRHRNNLLRMAYNKKLEEQRKLQQT